MLKLYRVSNDSFLIVSSLVPRGAAHGNTARTIATLKGLGMGENEIADGVLSLIENQHDVAEYGIRLCFIYSMPVRCPADLPLAARERQRKAS